VIIALCSLGSLAAAYLIGSIPFGFLVALWLGKVDIRTLGSGNIGATNVGRVLGFRFFVLVFLLDYAKGLLPTLLLPGIVSKIAGASLPDLPVGLAIAAILGHNFPIFLGFRGGKGVATSLGAVSALDPIASIASATGFATSLLLTRFVSLSSILGGLVWLLFHFTSIEHPWSRDQISMSIASLGLFGLLVARHRKNLGRIAAGTEPKVNFRKRRARPEGKAAALLVVGLAVLGLGGGALVLNAGRKVELIAGPYRVAEVARVATGHQRAERLAFADNGRLLVATCPRYGRVMLYRVTEASGLELVRDITVAGKPVALGTAADRLYVLVRPNNDARHVEEGWWETFDLLGNPSGLKVRVGFYPDDLAISPDGRSALVLTSGRGEGGEHRPPPALTLYDLTGPAASPAVTSKFTFDRAGDDPARLALSADGKRAAVSLQGSNTVAWLDLADPTLPRLEARTAWPEPSRPDAIRFDRLGGLLAADESGEALWHQAGPAASPARWEVAGGTADAVAIPGSPDYWAFTLPFDSGVGILAAGSTPDRPFERLPLKGSANLSATRPLGLAYEPGRSLLAVSNRSGGSIHLVALRPTSPAR